MKLRFRAWALLFASLFVFSACGGTETSKEKTQTGNLSEVVLEPGDIYAVFDFEGYGEVTFKLFPDIAPIAVERFAALAERGYYDSKNIHRIIKDFIMQGGSLYGDGTDGDIQSGESFNLETSKYARNFYGALCMVADSNKKNCYQFYIVNNKQSVDIDADIQTLEALLGDTTKTLKPEALSTYSKYLADMKALPDNIKELYKSRGGVFKLDGNNTVFGQMIEGMEIIDAISQVETVSGNLIDDAGDIQSKPLDAIIINSVKIVRIPLPEPTTVEETTTTKKGRKTTTTTTNAADPSQLTEVVAFGETTTAPDTSEDGSAETASDGSVTEAPVDSSQSDTSDTGVDLGTDTVEAVPESDDTESGTDIIEETVSDSADPETENTAESLSEDTNGT